MADLKSEADASNSNKPNDFVPFERGAARYAGRMSASPIWRRRRSRSLVSKPALTSKARRRSFSPPAAAKPAKPCCSARLRKIRQAGWQTILADIDPSNASFSRYFENVTRPDTGNPAGVAHWLQELIEHCIAEKQSAEIDLGSGDTTLRTLATEMPGLSAQIEAAGITRSMAFGRIFNSLSFLKLTKSSVTVWMPRLFAADAIESRLCGFHDARDVRVEPPLGVFESARVRAWLDAMDRRFAGLGSWTL